MSTSNDPVKTTKLNLTVPPDVLGMLDELCNRGFRKRTQEIVRLIQAEYTRQSAPEPSN